jgi:hypothetical protein
VVMKQFLCSFFFLLFALMVSAQSISGFVYDADGQSVPYATVSIKFEEIGTSCTNKGEYFLQFEQGGPITLVTTAVGFKNKTLEVILDPIENKKLDFYLERDTKELEEVSVVASKRDPAYGIISSAIKNKEKWKKQYEGLTVSMYIRALEVISEKEKKRREKLKAQAKKQKENEDKGEDEEDPIEKAKKEKEEAINRFANSMNMAEITLTRHFQAPNLYKDIREGYKKYGNQEGLYYIESNEDDFDFYTNLMGLYGLNEVPLISPLHVTSILTYKFKLEETKIVDDQLLYKIKVTPRKKGNASWKGHVWIQEESFAIMKVDLGLSKGGLFFYDDFNLKQEYFFNEDSLLLLNVQEFEYSAKSGGKNFTGKTIATYSDHIINPTFDKRFFKNELMVTTQEAYERDSLYWDKNRTKKLTKDEQRYQFVKDSLFASVNSDEYKDSVETEENKIKFLDIIWEGVEISDWRKKRSFYLGSIPEIVNPFFPGWLRFGYGGSYFKKWDSEQHLRLNGRLDYGMLNENFQGIFSGTYKYDPMRFGYVGFHFGRFYNVISSNDALTNLFDLRNWIEQDYIGGFWQRELINGLDFTFRVKKETYRSINDIVLQNEREDTKRPEIFPTYNSFNSSLNLSYTPFRKYITEPKKKVILGSKWPTLSVYYQKGFDGIFGSVVDFDFLRVRIKQNIRVSTLGTSTYKVEAGKFLNTDSLNFVDLKFFPQGDRYFFASLLESMQLQDTTIRTSDEYLQMHYVHHFNGSLLNYVPLLRKTQLHMVVGASSLVIPESDYRYVEAFVGAERSFRIQRSRFRLGVYFVAANSSLNDIKPRIKFAIQRYNTRNKNWEY